MTAQEIITEITGKHAEEEILGMVAEAMYEYVEEDDLEEHCEFKTH